MDRMQGTIWLPSLDLKPYTLTNIPNQVGEGESVGPHWHEATCCDVLLTVPGTRVSLVGPIQVGIRKMGVWQKHSAAPSSYCKSNPCNMSTHSRRIHSLGIHNFEKTTPFSRLITKHQLLSIMVTVGDIGYDLDII